MIDGISRFAELVDRPSQDVDLGLAALVFASVPDPDVDLEVWLAELDGLAAGVDSFEGLRRRLFVERGFTGDADDYYNPDNSLLHRVLQRRRGIPITLSVVAIEVGRRAGVVVDGVAMPGHFLVRSPESVGLCDPFHGGVLLNEQEWQDRYRQATGADDDVAFGPEVLPLADRHDILARMLANLAYVYRASQRMADLEWVLRCQRALPNVRARATLQLGQTLAAQGRFRQAAEELEATAEQVGVGEQEQLRRAAITMRARLN